MTFLVDVLATYRLTRLVVRDAITEPLRFKVKRAAMTSQVEDGVAAKLETLIGCPWCVSVYVAAAVVAARREFPGVWAPVAEALAASAAVGLIAENLD